MFGKPDEKTEDPMGGEAEPAADKSPFGEAKPEGDAADADKDYTPESAWDMAAGEPDAAAAIAKLKECGFELKPIDKPAAKKPKGTGMDEARGGFIDKYMKDKGGI